MTTKAPDVKTCMPHTGQGLGKSYQLTRVEREVLSAITSKGATLEQIGWSLPFSAAKIHNVVAKLCRLGYLKGTRQQALYTRQDPMSLISELHADAFEKLASSQLADADLRDADLRNRNFTGMDLRGANLEGADLRGADFSGANLEGAYLGGTNLEGTDLGDWELGAGGFAHRGAREDS